MLKMNLWDAKWDLDEAQCPCDIHFNQWIEANKITGKTIYHFGTGTHHIVGLTQAANGSDNVVFGITASTVEYEAYIKLAIERPQLSKSYLAYFGDSYLTNARLLPELDIATMFHAGEYIGDNTTSPEYGGDRRPRRRAHPARAHAAGRISPVLHRLVRVRQSRCARATCWKARRSSSASECSRSLLVCRKTWLPGGTHPRSLHIQRLGAGRLAGASSVIFSTRASA